MKSRSTRTIGRGTSTVKRPRGYEGLYERFRIGFSSLHEHPNLYSTLFHRPPSNVETVPIPFDVLSDIRVRISTLTVSNRQVKAV